MIDRRVFLALAAAIALPAVPALAAEGRLEIAYGEGPLRKLDLYPQEGLKRAPVLVFLHGGGWSTGDKGRVSLLPAYARRHGFLLVSANYRLTPQVDAGGCAQDVASALAWVRANAARYGGDPRRIVVAGHSAGAHLAALVAADPAYLGKHGMKPSDLAGVIALDGTGYDAVGPMEVNRRRPGAVAKWYAAAFGERAEELSPIRRLRAGVAYPPFLLFYVVTRATAKNQAQELAWAVLRTGGKAVAFAAPGDRHGTLNADFGKEGDPEGERAARFVKTGKW